MQCLGAPNRAQIDKAHAVGKSLDIGVPTLVVANDFETAQFDCSAEYMNWTADYYTTTNSVSCSVAQNFQSGLKAMNMERLENKECLSAYSSSFLSGRRNLIMVTNTTAAVFDSSHTNRSTVFGARNSTTWNQRLGMTDLWLPDRWPCYFSTANLDRINTDNCSASSVAADPVGWQVELQSGNFAIEYCLSQVVPEQCRLQSLPVLLLGVTRFNLLKLICMIVGALVLNDRPIMVLGDAAASFLQNPVRETEGKCLWGREDFKKTLWQRFRHSVLRKPHDSISLPYEYDGDRLRWSTAAPGGDWRFYYLWSVFKCTDGFSTLTHFFISESLFVVRIWVYDWQGNIGGGNASGAGGPYNNQLGYSAPATITNLILTASILTFVIVMGFKRFPTGLPVVGNNSLAISAACHPLAEDVDVAEKSVMWGAVYHETGDTPGHCCFSSLDVEPPIVGQLYAGVRKE
ncbi:hypothetical protein BP5796_06548 [Coleophoma crateriformis]|uniref:DUF6536 domain-containing protein n=1 Tax=Coleophoma crateriformis TaxID=565419 RepID=A0A3D8RNT7_9HELO|nr:hypothetical protein BP5796_06548 [Coleophoma crateriformis]